MNSHLLDGEGDVNMRGDLSVVPMAAVPTPYHAAQSALQNASSQPSMNGGSSPDPQSHYSQQAQQQYSPQRSPQQQEYHHQNNSGDQRKQLLFLAQAAEIAERFMDIVTFMSELITKHAAPGFRLTKAEERMLAVGLKNVTAQKRDAWRALGQPREDPKEQQLMREYQHQVQVEIYSLCQQVHSLLNILLPNLQTEDGSFVFLSKLQADYFRYMAEIAPGKGFENKSLESYRRAAKVAEAILPPTDPLRLGVTLNLSVLIFELLKDRNSAYAAARAAFDNAIPHLDKLDPKGYKDSTLLMQLLRDNLTLWSSAEQQQPQQ